jgi:hypothetical protein
MDFSGDRFSNVQPSRLSRRKYTIAILLYLMSLCAPARAQVDPPVPLRYRRFFAQYVDRRSILEKALNLGGMTGQDVGRSIALVAGVSHYPRLPVGSRYLPPAEADRNQLVEYLKKEEFFDEIVVLWDDDMNSENLSYFLKEYFPERLSAFPKSRFLFAYSGHGFSDGSDGYLLRASATSFSDKHSAINLQSLRGLMNDVVGSGYYVLVLLNSCYAGAFLNNRSFGGHYLPKQRGAHAITAGAAQEKAWSDSSLGPGSVFFEKVLAGLGGAADQDPDHEGIITVSGLYAYLRREVQISTDQKQAPQLGDLSKSQSEGEFFFLNRARQVRAKLVPAWKPTVNIPAGRAPGGATQEVEGNHEIWTTLAGTTPVNGTGVVTALNGSFGLQEIQASGATLRVELSMSSSGARYEQIELRTPFIKRNFKGQFAPSFGKSRIPVELEISFSVIVSTIRPSPDLALLPSSDGGFQLDAFTTSSCNFSCYHIEIVGTWKATESDLTSTGTIRSVVSDRGIGADATISSVDPTEFPTSIQLRGFSWSANSGGAPVPDDLPPAFVHVRIRQLSAAPSRV